MTWGGSYSGMKLLSVSIVNLQAPVLAAPDIAVSPTSYDFGNVDFSSQSTQTFTISNKGTEVLTIGTISIVPSAYGFNLTSDGCSRQNVNPLSACTVQVAFAPISVGSKTVTMAIPSNDPDESLLAVPLSGTGVVPITPDLSGTWSNATYTAKKKVGYTVYGTYTAHNTGSMDLANVVVNFYLSDDATPNSGELIKTYTFTTIAAKSSATTTIQFNTKVLPAGRHLIAWIDPSNSIEESVETNNLADKTILFQ
jgi:hypothetical protein